MSLRLASTLVALLFAACMAAACQQQGQGQPCDRANGVNNDCQSGLACVSVQGVTGTRCCPAPGVTPSSPDCNGTTTGTGDASTNPAPEFEGGTDAATATDASEAGGNSIADAAREGSVNDAGAGGSQDAGDSATSGD
jgi:hypothetical protein